MGLSPLVAPISLRVKAKSFPWLVGPSSNPHYFLTSLLCPQAQLHFRLWTFSLFLERPSALIASGPLHWPVSAGVLFSIYWHGLLCSHQVSSIITFINEVYLDHPLKSQPFPQMLDPLYHVLCFPLQHWSGLSLLKGMSTS